MNNEIINNSILLLSRLPGLGSRSARRMVFELMKKKEEVLIPLIEALSNLEKNVVTCTECNNLDVTNPCSICASEKRDKSLLCIVEDMSSLWAIEKSGGYNGTYFVLGGNLSAQRGYSPESIKIPQLLKKIVTNSIKELILATSPTVEGQITANYIGDLFKDNNVSISQLAQGIPIGGELEYLDEITLKTAINSRKII